LGFTIDIDYYVVKTVFLEEKHFFRRQTLFYRNVKLKIYRRKKVREIENRESEIHQEVKTVL